LSETEIEGLRKDNEALAEGVRLYRQILFPCERPEDRQTAVLARVAADEWQREHGHLLNKKESGRG
jgi:hypothetical protein